MAVSSSISDKLIGEMLTRYKTESANISKGDNVELEIRFKDVSKDMFEQLYQAINGNPEFGNGVLECSINTISENVYERSIGGKVDETRYIRKMVFTKGIKTEDSYNQKSRLMKPVYVNDYIKYSVGLSKEAHSKPFSTTTNALVRFKIRASFDYIGKPPHPAKWRIDLTAVKQGLLSDIGPKINDIKNDLFRPALSVDTFLREVNFDQITEYEVEIEHVDKATKSLTLEDLTIVKKIYSLVNPEYLSEIAYQEEIFKVAEYVVNNPNILPLFRNRYRLKQLSNQAESLTKNTYYSNIFPPHGYFLTEKADGVRCVVSINGPRCRLLTSAGLIEIINSKITDKSNEEVTIADCEMIVKDKKDPSKFDLYLFDCMVIRDENISGQGFASRVKYLDEAAKLIHSYVSEAGHTAKAKNFIRLDEKNLEGGFREVYEDEYPYDIDGMILTEPDEPYYTTRNYKWKPYEHMTIDFLAIKCPSKMLGIKPYEVRKGQELYLLFVGINHNMREKLGIGLLPNYKHFFPEVVGNRDEMAAYYPIQFSPSSNPLAYIYYHDSGAADIDRKIVELRRTKDNSAWEYVRVREDRKLEKNYFGNDFKVAELTYMNYIDPFELEDLWRPSSSYFTKTASDIHAAPNKYKRFVISLLLKDNISGSKWIIDEAAGRGADLHRYQEIGVENALFMDIDSTAIAELIRRKFEYFAIKKRHVRNWYAKRAGDGESSVVDDPTKKVTVVTSYDRVNDVQYDKLIVKDTHALTIHTLVADLKDPADKLIASTAQFGLNPGLVDGIVCNFALHYMCDTIEHIRNVLRFNSQMLKIGGLFIFTVMDGAKVFELLKGLKNGETWKVLQDNVPKYAITKKYNSDKLSAAGQTISVLMPFSDEMYDEPLCNLDTVITEAKKLGFELELNDSFDTYMDRFEKADRTLFDKLTDSDKEYIGLYSFVSLRKVRGPKVGGRRI